MGLDDLNKEYGGDRTQEEISSEEKVSKERFVEKSKAFGDIRSKGEILESLKALYSAVNEYVKDIHSKYEGETRLSESFKSDESQWLEKIKSISLAFYEYYITECKNDPLLLSLNNPGRKYLIQNLFNRFIHE